MVNTAENVSSTPNTDVIDLVAFAATLGSKHKTLANKVRELRDYQSIYADLRIAQDFVGSMEAIQKTAPPPAGPGLGDNIALALLNSAIIFYVRATKSGSNYRKTFDLRSKFDVEQKRDHKILCDLRDHAIAHFGPGGSYAGPVWQQDGVFVALDDFKIMTLSRRLTVDSDLTRILERATRRALAVIEDGLRARNSDVTLAINDAMREDDTVAEKLRNEVFPLRVFLDDEKSAVDVLTGPRTGGLRGYSRHHKKTG